jgi:hypothetical protein
MRVLSAADVVDLWERARGEPPFERALTVLAAAHPELTRTALAALPVGERDVRLLAIHERLFGRTLPALADCPRCSEQVEVALATPDLPRWPTTTPDDRLRLEADGFVLVLRHPNSNDLAAVASLGDPDAAHDALARRCVLEASRDGDPWDVASLPRSVTSPIAARLAAADPRADVLLSIQCPACAERWQALFDITAFLWSELAAEARRLFLEVGALARAYGWRESDILAMSARRRWSYLEIAQA